MKASPVKPSPLQAIIFDVDGTLADTERSHLIAFNEAFAKEGLPWNWDEALYTRLLDVSGGKERIAHYWREQQPGLKIIHSAAFADTVQRIHDQKTAVYETLVKDGGVALRPGVLRIINRAYDAGLQMAIATTTSPVNIAALLRADIGPDWARFFVVVEDASTAPRKKPHPQVYLQTLARLKLSADVCLAIEDSSNGLRAASAVGLPTVITTNSFTAHHDFKGALCVLPDLGSTTLEDLMSLHVDRCPK